MIINLISNPPVFQEEIEKKTPKGKKKHAKPQAQSGKNDNLIEFGKGMGGPEGGIEELNLEKLKHKNLTSILEDVGHLYSCVED
jgi:hypothetical protein